MTTWPALNLWADLQATKDTMAGQPADPRTSGAWTNIGAYVSGVTVVRGMSRYDGPVIRYAPGTLTAQLQNADQRFDPLDPSPTYPAGAVEPLRGLALQASWSGTHYKLWRGATDVWTPTYPVNGKAAIVQLSGLDALTQAGRFDFDNPSGVSGSGAGTQTGTWISEAMVEAPQVFWQYGWSPVNQGIATPGHNGWTGNCLAEAYKAVDTELGELYLSGAADLVFRPRWAIVTDARSNTSQATFDPSTSLPFSDLTVSYDDHGVRNTVIGQRTGGVAQLKTDAVSRGKYGLRNFSNTSLAVQTDGDAGDWAGLVLLLSKDATARIESLTIDPQSAPATLFPQVLTRELGDRITVAYTPPGGSGISRQVIIRGISHTVTLTSWRTVWALEDATKYDATDVHPFTFNDATYGKFDTGRLG
jgi:hypothetical protein